MTENQFSIKSGRPASQKTRNDLLYLRDNGPSVDIKRTLFAFLHFYDVHPSLSFTLTSMVVDNYRRDQSASHIFPERVAD